MSKVIFTILLSMLGLMGFAQRKYIYGRVFDSITLLPIQDVHVGNLKTDTSDYTNSQGLFVLRVSPSDTLDVVKVGYYEQKMPVSDSLLSLDTIRILFRPKTNELESVTVSAYSYRDYQADSMDRKKYFTEAIGYAQPVFATANTGAGVGISLERIFGHKQRNKKRALRLFESVEQEKYVDFRFNPILVHSYTGLKGDSLQQFLNKYRPDYDWLRSHPKQEALLYYINDKLKKNSGRKH